MVGQHDFLADFSPEIDALWQRLQKFPFDDKRCYAIWLAQTYYLVQHTTRLLALVASRMGPQNEALHQLCIEGLGEERGHDLLALGDVQRLGFRPEEFSELPETVAVYACQYYRTEYIDPIALFGHALLLEGLCSRYGAVWVDWIQGAHGKKATRFLALHALHDVDHFSEGADRLQNISQASYEAVLANMRASNKLYQVMLSAIEESLAVGKTGTRAA